MKIEPEEKFVMLSEPSEALARAMAEDAPAENRNQLDLLREKCSQLRDLDAEASDLEQRLEDVKAKANLLKTKTLPDLMAETGLAQLTLEPRGNLPALELKLAPFYSAGIAAKWPAPKRAEGMEYLDSVDAGDLIKTTITVEFSRDRRKDALDLAKLIKERGFSPDVSERVYPSSLAVWLRETWEDDDGLTPDGKPVDLDKIGGYVGRIVSAKAVKA